MSWRFRKSIKILPGVRLNVTNKGFGISLGGKGFLTSINSKGEVHTTTSIPGTGLYKRRRIGKIGKRR